MGGMRSPRRSDSTPLWSRAAEHFRAWCRGDQGALDDLVRALTPVLWNVVRAYVLDAQCAEDVVQETWLKLVRKRDDVKEPQAVTRWLTTAARREAWRQSRVAQRQQPVEDEVLHRDVEPVASAEQDAVDAFQRSLLWACVGQLDPRCQRLLRVVAFDERPDYSTLSEDLGMPVGSIGPTRGRCLGKLRALLATDSGRTL